jgi:hypothetical protein
MKLNLLLAAGAITALTAGAAAAQSWYGGYGHSRHHIYTHRMSHRVRALSARDVGLPSAYISYRDMGYRSADEGYGYGGREVISNNPVPDTPRTRAMYGPPLSRGGQMTAPAGD